MVEVLSVPLPVAGVAIGWAVGMVIVIMRLSRSKKVNFMQALATGLVGGLVLSLVFGTVQFAQDEGRVLQDAVDGLERVYDVSFPNDVPLREIVPTEDGFLLVEGAVTSYNELLSTLKIQREGNELSVFVLDDKSDFVEVPTVQEREAAEAAEEEDD